MELMFCVELKDLRFMQHTAEQAHLKDLAPFVGWLLRAMIQFFLCMPRDIKTSRKITNTALRIT